MGSVSVVTLLPGGDLGTGVGQRREMQLIQELVSKAATDALDVEQGNAIGPREPATALRGFSGVM